MMKKYAIVLVVALVLALSFAAVASAAQNKDMPASGSSNTNMPVYQATPKQFDATGATKQYPNGIYLPDAASPWNYRIHSGYSKNTDACASCHATHTAVGASLLQWYTIYETCMACHDGTVSTTYNVQDGRIRNTAQATSGGLFSTASDTSKSMHNVEGGVNIFAAPGGNPAATGSDGDWTASFSCNSCHNPHGTGGNSRILHPNPNRISQPKTVTVTVANSVYYNLPDYALRGFGYDFIVKNSSTPVTMENYQVLFSQPTQTSYLKWIGQAAAPGSLTVTYTPSLRVTMEITNYLASGGNEAVKYRSGVNEFCGACHRDYNAGKGSHIQAAGVYTKAYRHPVGVLGSFNWEVHAGTGLKFGEGNNQREILCLTCHFAHGTSSAFWGTTLNTDYWSGTSSFSELSGSSNLKRIPNMGTCESCHQMGPANLGYSVVADAKPAPPTTAAGYVGSATCGQCHDKYYQTQKNHLHTKKIQPAKGNPAFASTTALYQSWKPIADGGFQNLAGNINSIGAGQVDAQGRIKLVIGNVWISREDFAEYGFIQGDKWRQRLAFPYDALSALDKATIDALYSGNGTRSRGLLYLSAQFHTGQRGPNRTTVAAASDYANGFWVTYTEANVWQDACFSCHTTGFDMEKYVDRYGSTTGNIQAGNAHRNRTFVAPKEAGYIADYGVTCEACHGPGAVHAEYPKKDNIANPARLSVSRQNDACGACHARNAGSKKISAASTFINPDTGKYIVTAGARSDATTASNVVDVGGNPIANTFVASTYRMMNPGEKLTDFVNISLTQLTNNGLPNMHRMQFQELMRYNRNTTDFSDSARSLKGRLVSCNTCHDNHKYNAQGESLKQSLAATCSACHAGTVNMARAMPYIINAGGAASGDQNDILNLRTHIFNVATTDRARKHLSEFTGDVFNDTMKPGSPVYTSFPNTDKSALTTGDPAFAK